jgi:hypothetical protein
MIATVLLVCVLLALAAIAYFPGIEGAAYRHRLTRVVGKAPSKKLARRTFVFASIDGYHSIPLGICTGLAMAMLTLLVSGVLH